MIERVDGSYNYLTRSSRMTMEEYTRIGARSMVRRRRTRSRAPLPANPLLLAVFFLPASIYAITNCSIEPIYVDVHKREVHGSPDYLYGSFIGVGTPAQNQSIWPSIRQNETSFASTSFCGSSNFTNCEALSGGSVNITESST